MVAVRFDGEKSPVTRRRYVRRFGSGVNAQAGVGEGVSRDVGRENIDRGRRAAEHLDQDHGERIRFLAGRATRRPDARGALPRRPQDVFGDRVQLTRVAEKRRVPGGEKADQALDGLGLAALDGIEQSLYVYPTAGEAVAPARDQFAVRIP